MLPLAMNWFKQGRSIQAVDEVGVGKRKLDVIYQFIRAMPMICVEAYTCQELDKISSSKMELRREQLKLQLRISSLERMQLELFLKLKEVEDHEARAMRRL